MSKQDLIDFLLEKQGYLKEGASRLSSKLGIEESVCAEALREARKLVREEDDALEGMILKSRWQTASGEWRESYAKSPISKENLSEFKNLKEELLKDLKSVGDVLNHTTSLESKEHKYALEINLPDFHFGKQDGTSIVEQSILYVDSVKEIIKKAEGYEFTTIILPIGNDLLNSEGMSKATTKGTPQDDNTGWKESFRAAWLSLVSSINFLSTKAPVKIVNVLGNHDFERSFYVGELLSAYYSSSENVEVINNGEERIYLVYGNNLLAYTHGDKVKPHDLPLIMATEAPIEFSKTTFRSWRLGHLHKHLKDEYRGIEVEFLPALCGQDEWHKSMGYFSNKSSISYIWDFNGGKAGAIYLNK